MLPELIEVITTAAEKSDAAAIASMLVEKRLAACAQVMGPLESSYWWNDRLETAREWQVVAKTRGDLYASVESAIRNGHPYDEPEILAVPVVAVSSGYRMWLLEQLALPEKRGSEAASEPGIAGNATSDIALTAPADTAKATLPPQLESPGKLDAPVKRSAAKVEPSPKGEVSGKGGSARTKKS